jgi:hypothetical protein
MAGDMARREHVSRQRDILARRKAPSTETFSPLSPVQRQEVGHKTLGMTMGIYAKVKGASKRQAVAKLSYAQGAIRPTCCNGRPRRGLSRADL